MYDSEKGTRVSLVSSKDGGDARRVRRRRMPKWNFETGAVLRDVFEKQPGKISIWPWRVGVGYAGNTENRADPGRDLCCNCGPCRKKAELSPTHQVIRIARENGFDNVHDYLVWEKVGGTPESIKMRKKKFKWGQWVFDETLCAKCPSDDEGEEKIEEVEVEDDDTKNEKVRKDNEEDSDGSSDGDDCFKIVPSSRIYTLNTVNNIKF